MNVCNYAKKEFENKSTKLNEPRETPMQKKNTCDSCTISVLCRREIEPKITREMLLKSLPEPTNLKKWAQHSFLASGFHVEEISKRNRLVGYVMARCLYFLYLLLISICKILASFQHTL